MQVNQENIAALRNYLMQTLSPDATQRKQAEVFLTSLEKHQGFPVMVLKVLEVSTSPQDSPVRQAASVLFKNFIKRNWASENNAIAMEDRETIKVHIVNLMCSTPPQVQAQLSDALTTICEYDFPEQWPHLLDQLVTKFNTGDWRVINGVLLTANTIFKRFRNVFKRDELLFVLKHCLENFQSPLTELLKLSGTSLANSRNNREQTTLILEAIRKIFRIFYSFNWLDLPEFFEDNMSVWMEAFNTYLKYQDAMFNDVDEHNESSPVDKLQGAVVENLSLYAEKYEEEFRPYLKVFTELVWSLLSSQVTQHPKHDTLTAVCMRFLRNVSKQSMNKDIFKEHNVLRDICTHIVVKNLELRNSDEELFEDNPMEYIRRDIEDSDSDSRRSAARDLVRGLLKNYNDDVTAICLELVGNLLQQYSSNPVGQWKLKDVAINVVIALAVRKESRAMGVSELNPRVPVLDIFQTHILTELRDPTSSNKMLKADAIKFVSTFRNQMTVEMVASLMPLLIKHLIPVEFVLHTYAASCIERLLSVKGRFNKSHLTPILGELLTAIFSIFEQPNYKENDYLMKCVMRVMNTAGNGIIPYADTAATKLRVCLGKICANPSNPTYSHYLFEAISLLIRNVCSANPSACAQFEQLLFPPFQQVLTLDVEALSPYVFQVFAQLLELRTDAISEAYISMFPLLLTPVIWERNSNVPGLVLLISAYLLKGPDEATKHIAGILGVFQKLISSRLTEHNAFSLIRAVFCYLPMNVVAPYNLEIFKIMMMRLQTRMGGPMGVLFVKDLLYTLSCIVGRYGPTVMIESVEACKAGLSQMLLTQVWIPHIQKVHGALQRKACAIGMSRILCEAHQVQQEKDLWGEILVKTMSMIESKEEDTTLETNGDILEQLEETGYEAGFSKLTFGSSDSRDFFKDIASPKTCLAESLSKLSVAQPGQYPAVAQKVLPAEAVALLSSYFQQAEVAFQ